jgi:hypothetical protein
MGQIITMTKKTSFLIKESILRIFCRFVGVWIWVLAVELIGV